MCENCEECKEPCKKRERCPSVYQRLVVASTEAKFEDLSSSEEESPVVDDDDDGDEKRVPPETKDTVANEDDDNCNGNHDGNDVGDNMQTASKETQTEAGAWIIPGRQSQTLLEDFERERDVPIASLSGHADYASDKEKKGRPVPVFAPEHEAASGHGWRTPRSPPAPLRPVKMSADVGCGDGNRGCQCRRHCCSEQNAACSGDSAELRGGCVNFCSGRREMSSSVFARASSGSPPGSVLFAENDFNKDYAAADYAVALPTSSPLFQRSAAEAGTRVAVLVHFFRGGGGCPRQKEGQD